MAEPLSRLYAYPVSPGAAPEGGSVPITADLDRALDEAYHRARISRGRTVSLALDEETGTSEVRQALMAVAFGGDQAALAAADLMAGRLAGSMDRRSSPGLLVISVHGEGSGREVELWMFPRYSAFRYASSGEDSGIELADDIFSMSSSVRKAATFSGGDGSGFRTGRVVDFQAHGADRFVAGFWVDRFLDARLEMAGEEGTLLFGKVVKQALDSLRGDAGAQRELADAVFAVRSRPAGLSLRSFADEHLGAVAAEAVISRAPGPEAVEAEFMFDPELFAAVVGFRVFRLRSGVTVTVPMGAVGESVELVEEDGELVLEARDVVTGQTVRSRG